MGMTATEGWNSFNFLSNNHQQQLGNLCNLFSVVSTFFLVNIEWKVLVSNIEKSVNFNRDFLFWHKKKKSTKFRAQNSEQSMRNNKKASQNQMSTSRTKAFLRNWKFYLQIGGISGRYYTQAMRCQLNWWNRACVRVSDMPQHWKWNKSRNDDKTKCACVCVCAAGDETITLIITQSTNINMNIFSQLLLFGHFQNKKHAVD